MVYALLGAVGYLAAARRGLEVALAYEYLVSGAALAYFWACRPGRRPAGPPAPADRGRPSPAHVLAVPLLTFAAIMALRLYVFGTIGQIWGKGPMLMLTLAAALGYEGWDWADLGLTPGARSGLPGRGAGGAQREGGAGGLMRHLVLGVLACLWMWAIITASYLVADLLFVGAVEVSWARPEVTGLAVVGLALRFLQGNFAEELFFRGYVLRAWEKSLGPRASLLGQALLFGLFHVNYHLFPPQPLPILTYVLFSGAFGLAMGIITRRAGTLIPAAMAHPFYNLTIACGLASVTSTWKGHPRAPVAVVRTATYLIQVALHWWVLPRLMDWSVRIVAATPPGGGIPCRPSAVRIRRGAPPRDASPAG